MQDMPTLDSDLSVKDADAGRDAITAWVTGYDAELLAQRTQMLEAGLAEDSAVFSTLDAGAAVEHVKANALIATCNKVRVSGSMVVSHN